MVKGTTVVERSENAKVGRASATYASQATCPPSCPLLGNGCYAEKSFTGITTRRLGQSPSTPHQLAIDEAKAIDTLTGQLDLRVHVVGDCPTESGARTIGQAMRRHEAKHGRSAWTYTHAWRTVRAKAWQGANVLASCDSIADLGKAWKQGYKARALVLRKGTELFDNLKTLGKTITLDNGTRLIPCPNQVSSKKPTCIDCRLCMKPELLARTNSAIAFLEH
jgi:hypothetical protein